VDAEGEVGVLDGVGDEVSARPARALAMLPVPMMLMLLMTHPV